MALVFAGAGALSTGAVPIARALGRRLDVIDHPGERKVHTAPTPRFGGVAVFGTFLLVVLAGYLMVTPEVTPSWMQQALGSPLRMLREAHRVETKLLAVLGGAAVAFVVGLLDDVLGPRFPVGVKAVGQLLAAGITVTAGVRTSFMPYEWMNVVLTVVWLVGMTNAFNLLDNMDGLSAGDAFIASAVLLGTAWSLGEFFISLILAAFLGALLGFLFFNSNPASVFLGDCGSLFIGFMMGALTLLERYTSHASSTLFPVLMPVLLLAVPLADTATVVAIRVREGRPIYVGDRCHLSHRLVARGFSQRGAVWFLYLMTLCLGLGAASLTDATAGEAFGILVQSVGFIALVLILLFAGRRPASSEVAR